MKIRFLAACAGVLVFFAAGMGAFAEDVRREVRSGQRSPVLAFSIYSLDTCYAGPVAEARIVAQPAHGRVEILRQKGRMASGNCGTLEVWGQQVYYASKSGFRGQDEATVEFTFNPTVQAPRVTTRRYTIQITVK